MKNIMKTQSNNQPVQLLHYPTAVCFYLSLLFTFFLFFLRLCFRVGEESESESSIILWRGHKDQRTRSVCTGNPTLAACSSACPSRGPHHARARLAHHPPIPPCPYLPARTRLAPAACTRPSPCETTRLTLSCTHWYFCCCSRSLSCLSCSRFSRSRSLRSG